MMNTAKPIWIRILPILVLFTTTSCLNNNSGLEDGLDGLRIISVNPMKGKHGTEVTISGFDFGETPGENKVSFNGFDAEVVSASSTKLKVLVPRGARSGPVGLTVNGKTVEGPKFAYLLTVHVSTYAGSGKVGFLDGPAPSARFNYPVGLELLDNGDLVVVDYWNHSIRIVSSDGNVSTLAGDGEAGTWDGVGSDARFFRPIDVAVAPDGSFFVSDFGNHLIRHITASGSVNKFAGSVAGYNDGPSYAARFRFPAGITLAANDTLYVSDSENNLIRWVAPDGNVGTYAGSGYFGFVNGHSTQAQFRWPFGLASDNKQRLYIADHTNHSIRMVNTDYFVSTISGDGEAGFMEGNRMDARYDAPYDVVSDDRHYVYVADYLNNRIRMISPTGTATTVAGKDEAGFVNGDETQALFNRPIGLAVNEEGTVLFVADHFNHAIRKITME